MSSKNLKLFAQELIEEFKDAKAGKGSKEEKRAQYEKLSPQVFVQNEAVLKKEIASLQAKLSGKPGTSKKAEEIEVKPPITLEWKEVKKIWRSTFATFKKLQKTKFNGTKKGTNKEYLTSRGKNNDWTELTNAARNVIGGGKWYICPVLNYDTARDDLKKTFGRNLAAAEIRNRKGTNRRRDEVEASYISSRITGHQGSKVPVAGKGYQLYRDEGLTTSEKQSGIQLGHGEYGSPSFLRKAEEAEKQINKAVSSGKLTKDEGKMLKAGIYVAQEEWKVHLEHVEKLSLKSGFKKKYTLVIVSGQRTSDNMRDADKERNFGNGVKAWWVKAAKSEHKTRLPNSVGNLILGRLVTGTHRRIKNVSKRWTPLNTVKSRERSKTFKTIHKERRKLAVRNVGLGLAATAKSIVKGDKSRKPQQTSKRPNIGQMGSPLQVLSLFNANLEQAIRENMVGGALHNRTGRFAESVKVINLIPTAGTSGTAQYTYMKDPYQVFEGEGSRDPRLLIDKTVREQAAEMALGKFTTQRV